VGSTITTKLAFVHHANQHIAYIYEAGIGYHRVLDTHEYYRLPVNLHLSGTLMTSLAWNEPIFLNRIKKDVVIDNLVEILGSVMGQNIMPYIDEPLNLWAENESRNMCNYFFGYDPKVAWVPERVWKSFIDNDLTSRGFKAVVLDGKWHHDKWCGCGNYHLTHKVSATENLQAFFIDERWYGKDLPRINADLDFKRHWAGINRAGDERQICVYGDDWEKAAGYAPSWPAGNPDRYDAIIRWLAGARPWIQVVKLSDYLNWYAQPTSGNTITITNQGPGWPPIYEDYDPCYNTFKVWVPPGCTKDAETLWKDVLSALGWQSSFDVTTPSGRLKDFAMTTLSALLFETGWRDDGNLVDWGRRKWAHLRYAMMAVKAADWVGNLPPGAQAYWQDVDDDGGNELVICNRRLYAVIENIGGRIVFIATSDGRVLLGNLMADYFETEGDYNDTDHVGALTDKWYTYNNTDYSDNLYSITVEENLASGAQVRLVSSDGNIVKRVRLESGENENKLKVSYALAHPGTLFVRGGFSPDVKDLMYSGQSAIVPIGGPSAGYMGWGNRNTGACVRVDWKWPSASYSTSTTMTLAEMLEVKSENENFRIEINTAPLRAGVSVSISPENKSGFGGSTLTFGVAVGNLGEATDTIKLTVSDNAVPSWNPSIFPSTMSVGAGSSGYALLSIRIPSGPPALDNIRVIVRSSLDPAVSASDNCVALGSGSATFKLVTLYKVGIEKDLLLYEGRKLAVKFYSYENVYENENLVHEFTPPWRVGPENENASHPGIAGVRTGVKKAMLWVVDEGDNEISKVKGWVTIRSDLWGRVGGIRTEWPYATAGQRSALWTELGDIRTTWPYAPTTRDPLWEDP
jgi:hypothetical protein